MAVFYIILGNDAVILDPLFRKEINRICLLYYFSTLDIKTTHSTWSARSAISTHLRIF